jgi:hypothetical protein
MNATNFIIWTCCFIFAFTGIITLLGLINVVKIKSNYLNRLFIALILEIIPVGIFVFKSITTEKRVTWMVTTNLEFYDENGNLYDKSDQIKFANRLSIQQLTPAIIDSADYRSFQFYVYGNNKDDHNIKFIIRDKRDEFCEQPLNLSIDTVSFDDSKGEIKIPTIKMMRAKPYGY